MQQTGTVSSGDSVLEVEYQVPTSSQRDHDDDNVIVLESDEDGGADEGEGADDEPDDPDTEGYDIETMVCLFFKFTHHWCYHAIICLTLLFFRNKIITKKRIVPKRKKKRLVTK